MQTEPPIRIFLCGDVMTGRGIDQILPHPGNPMLYESFVRDARDYVELAERHGGPIPRSVAWEYVWGEALPLLDRFAADVRIVNLESSITTSDDYWRDKPVLYRMHPRNIGCLTAARIDCCTLANNHVLDWGYPGLDETLRTLRQAGLPFAGAGENAAAAAAPAVLEVPPRGRVLVFSMGSVTSGVPRTWGATPDRAGVHLLPDLSERAASRIAGDIARARRPGDLAIASIHWGSNWGYEVPREQRRFARRLIDEGGALVHGHSSHHVRPFEIYRGRLIIYGCGDFLTDYEGIGGYEAFRGDLALMYLIEAATDGTLREVRLMPLQVRRFRLERCSEEDTVWMANLLRTLGEPEGIGVSLESDGGFRLDWPR